MYPRLNCSVVLTPPPSAKLTGSGMERAHHHVRIFADPESLARAAAELIVEAANGAVAQRGRFMFVLSGGATPKRLYSLLAGDPEFRARMPWSATWFFFGDERNVPPDDPASNYRMAYEAMLNKAPIEAAHVLRMKGELQDTEQAAREYEEVLRGFYPLPDGVFPAFDLVLLGIGADGHTASLFPHTAALRERTRWVCANWVPQLQTHRITLTAPVLNSAGLVLFLVEGAEKAEALRAVLAGPVDPDSVPAQMIEAREGAVSWLTDEAAAALLGDIPSDPQRD